MIFTCSTGAGDPPSVTRCTTCGLRPSVSVTVLRLVAEGRTNREIGDALYISASTAGVHVSNILRKLGAASRAQAAALAHEDNLLPDSEPAPSAAANGR
jgi:hypothetical protein